ncbi:uncharacterized protein SPPG_02721 [Spizellomyces punctatus DAOM BR117]|uniref:Uncharacterized protein n=1 Tax=Spizellomyces punctatus (strain DAOM BR117) TaxID=645134 RepID=A0A0L0HMU2_SPIPD|nr:uncharacterized protein SPPG_02721 [Spizellomyces punctatus DAOM BR117]KND02240.1 hypothetical protein SPPG_02721 [Spizellomyces punctatus DAOM BR117]|eukprot:XP_016610279.1 hypothetical protein SPPG_02721 [Spizellomyces punctatus DAOM BR117]
MQITSFLALAISLAALGVVKAVPAPQGDNIISQIASAIATLEAGFTATTTTVAATTVATTLADVGTKTVSPATIAPVLPSPSGAPVLPPICRRAGCNGELCVTNSRDAVLTPCVWRPEFACYATAQCGYNATRRACAWRQTKSLKECLSNGTTATL